MSLILCCSETKIIIAFKVVVGGYHIIFFEVKVKTVKLIGGRRYLAVRSGLKGTTGGLKSNTSHSPINSLSRRWRKLQFQCPVAPLM